MTSKQPKMKKCKLRTCQQMFLPSQFGQVVCNWRCSIGYVEQKRLDKIARQLVIDRKSFKVNDKKTQRNLAQKYFNRFIRLRDHGQPCISCQRSALKKINAGHYRTTAAAPQLRFNELNCHLQCEPCNSHLSGNIGEYRIHLTKKIGLERVEWLEGNHEPKKYSAADYVAIKLKYLEKCKELDQC